MRTQILMAALAAGLGGCKKEEPMPTPPPRIESKPTTGTAAATPDDAAADVTAKLGAARQFIEEKKFDEADTALKRVEAEKDKLPEVARQQLAALRQSLDTARAAVKAEESPPKVPEANVATPGK